MYYTLSLPIYKQGDDLAYFLKTSQPCEALLLLAEQYKLAAEICELVSNTIKDIPDIEINADTHHIGISSSFCKKMQILTVKKILIKGQR